MLLSVRSIFHIHLISKNPVNKTTAKASLTQILSVVNQRLEAFDAKTKLETEAALSAYKSADLGLGEELAEAELTAG